MKDFPKQEYMLDHAEEGTEDLLIEAMSRLGPCQVRSKTGWSCPRPVVVEIWSMPFCERCAHEQEAYFAIGELMQEEGGLKPPRRGTRRDAG